MDEQRPTRGLPAHERRYGEADTMAGAGGVVGALLIVPLVQLGRLLGGIARRIRSKTTRR